MTTFHAMPRRDPRPLRPWVRTVLQVIVCAAVVWAASWGML